MSEGIRHFISDDLNPKLAKARVAESGGAEVGGKVTERERERLFQRRLLISNCEKARLRW
jgi:hypothetical protein